MHPLSHLALAAAAAATLSGCAIVQSNPVSDTPTGRSGIPYMLPKALLPVQLVDSGGAIRLEVLEPVLVGDPSKLYVLASTGSVFSSEHLDIQVDAHTGLLKSVNVKSDDKTGEILKKIAAGKAGLKAEFAAAPGGGTVLFETVFDPGCAADVERARTELSDVLRLHVEARKAACLDPGTTADAKPLCALLATRPAGVTLQVQGPTQAKPPGPAASTPGIGRMRCEAVATEALPCPEGICHRPTLPHLIQVSLFGETRSALALLPNNAPVLTLPLERHAFVHTTHDVVLQDGSVTHLTSDVPSVGLAIAAAPMEVAKAAIEAVSEVVQLKIDLSGKQKELADAEAEKVKAQAALEAELAKQDPKPKPESALVGVKKDRPGVLLSAQVGTVNKTDSFVPQQKEGFVKPPATSASGAAGKGSDGSLGKQ